MELARFAGLLGLVGLIWAWHYEMTTADAWQTPANYFGDAHEMLTRIQAAAEGDTVPLQPQVLDRLGAPWGAHWNSYPTPDKVLVGGLGLLARFFGWAVASNLALLLAALSSAASFYWVARRFQARWEWAAAGALLFAFTYSVFHRGLGHLLLLFTWTIPLGLITCWFVARRLPLDWTSRRAWFCAFAAISLGASNPYNLFFWLQLLAWALAAQAVRPSRGSNLRVGLVCLAVALAAFVCTHAETWLYSQRGTLPVLERNYAGTEMFALKFVELFVPPSVHRWDLLAFFGRRYASWSEWRGEYYLPYLGIVGIAGFVWLAGAATVRMLRGRAAPGFALQTGWLLAYAGIGGGTNLLALYSGFQLFRATNRIGAFISCITLLFVAIHMTRWLRGRPRGFSIVLAALVSTIGVLDQIPKRTPLAEREATRTRVAADRAFGRTLEETLPAGSMVFQLPILGFPEVVPPHNLADYELFRPYLNTTTLRFSYGGTKYRSRNRWQRDLENLPPLSLVKKLERFGFAALYLNRKGFADGGEQIVQALRNAGYTRILEGPLKEQYVILLNPRKKRELPLGSTFTFGKGWYSRPLEGPQGQVRWAHGPAVVTYYNPYDRPLSVRIQLRLSAPTKRTVTIASSGRVVVRALVGPEVTTLAPIAVDLIPGVNRFDVSADGPVVKVPGTGARLRMVGMHEVRLSVPELPPLALRGEPSDRSNRNSEGFFHSHVYRRTRPLDLSSLSLAGNAPARTHR